MKFDYLIIFLIILFVIVALSLQSGKSKQYNKNEIELNLVYTYKINVFWHHFTLYIKNNSKNILIVGKNLKLFYNNIEIIFDQVSNKTKQRFIKKSLYPGMRKGIGWGYYLKEDLIKMFPFGSHLIYFKLDNVESNKLLVEVTKGNENIIINVNDYYTTDSKHSQHIQILGEEVINSKN